ncbi:MAG: hypothetical protein ACR2PH_05540 [Desulfobulbia bacterium]
MSNKNEDLLRIVSKGGLVGNGTKVFIGEKQLPRVRRIEIEPLEMHSPVKATITFIGVELDIEVTEKDK